MKSKLVDFAPMLTTRVSLSFSPIPEALKAFESASKLADSGEIQYRIASIYLDLGEDKKAYKASVKAANKGGINEDIAIAKASRAKQKVQEAKQRILSRL